MELRHIRFLIFPALAILIFFGIFFIERFSDNYSLIKSETDLNMLTKKIKYKKGMVLIDDSISISGNCPMLPQPEDNKGQVVLGDFSGPYRIMKKKYSDTVKIVISHDTLYFKFIDITK